MKHILFVIPTMQIGGTRSSLLNLLKNMSTLPDVSIDLYILGHAGPLMKSIPKNITVIQENRWISKALPGTQKGLIDKLYHIGFYTLKRIIGYQKLFQMLFSKAAKALFREKGEYDAVFGYQEGISSDFVRFIKAKKRYLWIHSDYEKWDDKEVFSREAYQEADNIIFVADATRKKFCETFAEFTQKSIVIQNTIDVDEIKRKAHVTYDDGHECSYRFVSVGRVVEAKAFDRIIPVAEALRKSNVSFHWNVVGGGTLFDELMQKVEESGLEQYISLLNQQANPYVYVKNSDAMVVTSINESQPMVLLEALTLGVPVVSTRFASAVEVIGNNGYGIICENNVDSLKDTLLKITASHSIIDAMKVKAQEYSYDNQHIVQMVQKLF